MADVKSLVKALKDMAVTQYGKGAPYRNALASALKGDMGGLQELNKPSPVMPNEALDVAMTFAPMGITAFHGSPLTNLTELNPKKSFGNLGVSWVSPNKEFAGGYNYVGKNGKVYEIDLNEGKSFNFNNAEHLNFLKEKAKDIPYYDRLRGMTTLDKRIPDSSSYYSAEDPDIFNLIKKLGYDTVKVTENGIENIGVFNPKKNAKIIK